MAPGDLKHCTINAAHVWLAEIDYCPYCNVSPAARVKASKNISVPATDVIAAVRLLCKHYDPLAICDAAARERPDWKGRKNG